MLSWESPSELDDEAAILAHEVDDESIDRFLSPEPKPELTTPHFLPEEVFSERWVPPHRTCEVLELRAVSCHALVVPPPSDSFLPYRAPGGRARCHSSPSFWGRWPSGARSVGARVLSRDVRCPLWHALGGVPFSPLLRRGRAPTGSGSSFRSWRGLRGCRRGRSGRRGRRQAPRVCRRHGPLPSCPP